MRKWNKIENGLPEMFVDVEAKLFNKSYGLDSVQYRHVTDAQGKLTKIKMWHKSTSQTHGALYVTHWRSK